MVTNIAAYKFVDLNDLETLQAHLTQVCQELNLKGTILLATEGLNLMLAGPVAAIDNFLHTLTCDQRFADIEVKRSESIEAPFRRMRVRIKNEIVNMRMDNVRPLEKTGQRLSAMELKQWLDEKRDFIFLDTRNDYEIEIGKFAAAEHLSINMFNQFPEAVKQMPVDREKPMVMYCTGGIRCEKASVAALEAGFKEVYQLEGGILKYFEECGDEHYEGNCFIFDQRTAVTPQLAETGLVQCPRCDHFIQPEEQNHPDYVAFKRCQYCSNIPNTALSLSTSRTIA